ncbi:MAG: hypothetical protein NT080_07375 [Spirochaetes bacterium]|nr:hypothetical protein [Spirochaetota bacterium]
MSGFDREVVMIHPGEWYASGDEIVIGTVLGSCVSVALYDRVRGVGGLNHFMLPGEERHPIEKSDGARFGMFAMDLLINGLMKLGSSRAALQAKIFGGAAILTMGGTAVGMIGDQNIRFAIEYLEGDGIPIVASDVGGLQARKLFLFPKTGKVLMKRFGKDTADLVAIEEKEYIAKVELQPDGAVTLFKP